MKTIIILISTLLAGVVAQADISVKKVKANLSEKYFDQSIWQGSVTEQTVTLLGQPMTEPRSKNTETPVVNVAAVHDGKWITFRLRWKDTEVSEGGKLATFGDAVAIEFPVKSNENPPPVIMGAKDDPVHILHWKYDYQVDEKNGKKSVSDIYPNMTTDIYPMEYKDKGNYKEATKEQREAFVGGTAAGNPQSFSKTAVDEILAEGFGTSAVMEQRIAKGKGEWKDGEWTVYISRPLTYANGSNLYQGKKSQLGIAVWQGGKKEVGALKSLTMMWTPINLEEN